MIILKKVKDPKNRFDDIEVEMKIDSESSWDDVIENTLNFLRACGYVIPYGDFEIIQEEEKEDYVEIPVEPSIEALGCDINYCNDCSCGKKEAALREEISQDGPENLIE